MAKINVLTLRMVAHIPIDANDQDSVISAIALVRATKETLEDHHAQVDVKTEFNRIPEPPIPIVRSGVDPQIHGGGPDADPAPKR